jgi:spore germination cell wall hydrolase CwlJ-like protein
MHAKAGSITALIMTVVVAMAATPSGATEKSVPAETSTVSATSPVNAVGTKVGRIFDLGRYLAAVAKDVASVSKRELAVSEQYRCLAQAVYFEARGESSLGQMAVAHVVLNRVRDRRYPNTICAVVFQNDHRRNRCQFSFACDGQPDRAYNQKAWRTALKLSLKTLAGATDDITLASTHYHATYVAPYWASHLKPTVQFGQHLFYREDRPGARLAHYTAN